MAYYTPAASVQQIKNFVKVCFAEGRQHNDDDDSKKAKLNVIRCDIKVNEIDEMLQETLNKENTVDDAPLRKDAHNDDNINRRLQRATDAAANLMSYQSTLATPANSAGSNRESLSTHCKARPVNAGDDTLAKGTMPIILAEAEMETVSWTDLYKQ